VTDDVDDTIGSHTVLPPGATEALQAAGGALVGRRRRDLLLACGIAASALAAGADVLAGNLWEGYSFTAQSISELSAVGASTRPLALPLNITYDVFMLAFAAGVWESARDNRLARVTASLVGASAAAGLVFRFLPMHLGEPVGTPANTANVVAGATSVFLFLGAVGFGAASRRGWFRWYSGATLAAYAALTVAGVALGRQAAAGPHSATGAQERTMMAGYLLWVVVLALVLLREQSAPKAGVPTG
jgi:hypothetical protein